MTVTGSSARALALSAVFAVVVPLLAANGSHADTPSFFSPVRAAGVSGYEPGIDITGNGTVFYNSPAGGNGLQSGLARSTNGGASFAKVTFPQPYSRYPGGGDDDVAVTPDGHVYMLDLWVGSNSVIASDDNGATWTRGSPFTTLPLSDREWVAVGSRNQTTGRDTVYAIYTLINPPFWVMLARSRDGGETWDFHTPVGGAPGNNGRAGQPITDGDYIGVPLALGGELVLAESRNAGETWTRRTVASFYSDASPIIFGFAKDGQDMYAAWISSFDYSVQVSQSHDEGVTWTPDDGHRGTLSAPDTSNVYPWIDARTVNGVRKVAVAWYGAALGLGAWHDPNKVPDSSAWKLYYSESLDGGTTFTPPKTTQTGTVKTGIVCTKGITCTSDRELGDFMQVAINPVTGASLIAYGDFVCDPLCGSGNVLRQSSPLP